METMECDTDILSTTKHENVNKFEKRISFFTGEVSAIYSICPLLPLNVTTTGDDIPTIFSSRRLRRLCAVASVAKCIQQYPNLTTIKTRKAIHIFLLSRFFSFTFCVCSFRVFFPSLFARTCVWVVSVRAIVNTYGRRTHLLLIFPSMLYCVLCVDVPIENYQFHIYRECTHTGTQTQCGGSLFCCAIFAFFNSLARSICQSRTMISMAMMMMMRCYLYNC